MSVRATIITPHISDYPPGIPPRLLPGGQLGGGDTRRLFFYSAAPDGAICPARVAPGHSRPLDARPGARPFCNAHDSLLRAHRLNLSADPQFHQHVVIDDALTMQRGNEPVHPIFKPRYAGE